MLPGLAGLELVAELDRGQVSAQLGLDERPAPLRGVLAVGGRHPLDGGEGLPGHPHPVDGVLSHEPRVATLALQFKWASNRADGFGDEHGQPS